MIRMQSLGSLAVTTALMAFTHTALGQNSDTFEVGLNADINFANGKPANDIIGSSLTGTYRMNSNWLIGFRYGVASFDYERPYGDLNFNAVTVVDSSADSDEFSVFIERRYNERNAGLYWYWTAGAGFNDVKVGPASGTTVGGDNFLITSKVDTETLFTASLGQRYNFANRWSVGYGLRAEQRYGDWKIQDQVSGLSKVAVDSYFVYGLFIETRFKF